MTIADHLASALRRYGKCECESKKLWPWKRDVKCGMCLVLEQYDQRVSCTHEYAREGGRCAGCGEDVND